ncbi:MAG: topoisomerase [Piscirickettsiaceae bacterium]|nr:MAG: topoisomerase [Piscirickettsiaceae bacterium]PCI71383.1 MAG: topoisomerase [Piscirickettsiaceae bacterium]
MFKKTFLFIATLLVSFSAFAVNINTASAEEIAAALKGVGESKAGAIIVYREKHGPFKTLNDLTKVKGIGAATVDKNRENIELKMK